MSKPQGQDLAEAVAIIGMAGRFPGARNIDELWRNLRDGVESVSFFSDKELIEAGIDRGVLADPSYVKAGTVLEDADLFDARFFGFNPREAEVLDPQQRLFLECSHQALELAGYDPRSYPGLIGVHAGSTISTYWLHNLHSNPQTRSVANGMQTMIGNEKDFVPARVSYKLHLKGPSVNVQTACSTSLVAVHLACQSLLAGECDIALAGGVSVIFPQPTGYHYQTDGIVSPDGHCRPFDASARGTVPGNGVAIVVLKRLSEAVADGDTIDAVIRGSAINNDGSNKVGFTAPSVEGQAEVIALAQAAAKVEPDSIGYIEAHGTATYLGDPIEMEALQQAFRACTKPPGFCALGSIKGNLGHSDAAAGVTGLIKAALQIKNRCLVPSLHFREPNPQTDWAQSPFYVNTRLMEWNAGSTPRRAGVSSFGIGGTNAHVILEEAPPTDSGGASRPWQLLALSAKSKAALETASKNLAAHLRHDPEVNLADVAHTLQRGRTAYEYRRVVLSTTAEEAAENLSGRDPERVYEGPTECQQRPVFFMFPGQGSQYLNMGRELYLGEETFRLALEQCAECMRPELGIDLREALYPREAQADPVSDPLIQTSLAQPAIFAVEYALAQLWMEWGVLPSAMIGHSLGELVAACLAGVFSLEDASRIVAVRGRLMQSLPRGAMLSVSLPENKIETLLGDSICLAAINAASLCSVSGPVDAIAQLEGALNQKGIPHRRLHTSHAFHSPMMEPIMGNFESEVSQADLAPPRLPFISNVSGTWILPEEATSPRYWARQLRQTVQFNKGTAELITDRDAVLLEVGPGQALSTLVKSQLRPGIRAQVVSSIRPAQRKASDIAVLLKSLGQLWCHGVSVDWSGFYKHENRRRLRLPTYPFERQRFWVAPHYRKEEASLAGEKPQRKADLADWFYVPSWQQTQLPRPSESGHPETRRWLVFVEDGRVGPASARRLRQGGQEVITVGAGSGYAHENEGFYSINPSDSADYHRLIQNLEQTGKIPSNILHFWSVGDPASGPSSREYFSGCQDQGYYSLLFLAQALAKGNVKHDLRITVISSKAQRLPGDRENYPEKATLLGPCEVVPQEYPHLNFHQIDLTLTQPTTWQEDVLVDQLLAEASSLQPGFVVAYRDNQRWVRTFEPIRLEEKASSTRELRSQGTYLITGGLGRIGLLVANYLARQVQAKLVLVGRSPFPQRSEWERYLESEGNDTAVSGRIRQLLALEELGSEVLVLTANVADQSQMEQVLRNTHDRFGPINGVFHTAGAVRDNSLFASLTEIGRPQSECHFEPKAYGLYTLERIFEAERLDFCCLFSSNAAILGGLSFVAYSAANLFMDAFASSRNPTAPFPWLSVNWDGWLLEENRGVREKRSSLDELSMTPKESTEALRRAVTQSIGSRLIVSAGNLAARVDTFIHRRSAPERTPVDSARNLYDRPEVGTAYEEPRDDVEKGLVEIWQALLGIQPIGIFDNFFDLGGHSLMGTQLMSRVRQVFQIDMELSHLFESPTVAGLAEVVCQKQSERDESERMRVFEMVENLSEEEVETELNKRIRGH